MSSRKIDETTKKAFVNGDSIAMTVPKGWKALIGMRDSEGKEDFNLKLDLMKGRHGHFIAVYGNHQKR